LRIAEFGLRIEDSPESKNPKSKIQNRAKGELGEAKSKIRNRLLS